VKPAQRKRARELRVARWAARGSILWTVTLPLQWEPVPWAWLAAQGVAAFWAFSGAVLLMRPQEGDDDLPG
jgi:hypothetical protein